MKLLARQLLALLLIAASPAVAGDFTMPGERGQNKRVIGNGLRISPSGGLTLGGVGDTTISLADPGNISLCDNYCGLYWGVNVFNQTYGNADGLYFTFNGTAAGRRLYFDAIREDGAGPLLHTHHTMATAAVSDELFTMITGGSNSVGMNDITYGKMTASILDPTAGSEDSQYQFETMVAGTRVTRLSIGGGLVLGSAASDPGMGWMAATGVDTYVATTGDYSITAYDTTGSYGGAWLLFANLGASPAATDVIGGIDWNAYNTTPTQQTFLSIDVFTDDVTPASEDGSLRLRAMVAGTLATRLSIGNGIIIGPGTTYPGVGNIAMADNSFIDLGTGTWTNLNITQHNDLATGPSLDLYAQSASPAVNDYVGGVNFDGNNSSAVAVSYSGAWGLIADATAGSEDGKFEIDVYVAGVNVQAMLIGAGAIIGSGTTFPGAGKLRVDAIELGADTDTTIARSGAGAVTVEGVQVVLSATSPTLATITTTGNIELGNATDTTLSRGAAGQLNVEGNQVAELATAQTWTDQQTWAAGSASIAPFKLQSGTNLTTAAVGAVEFDGTAFYATAIASTRQVWDTEQLITLTTAYTLANQTAAQKAFNSSTNGAVTLGGSTTYFFEFRATLTGLSGSSHSVGFAFGGTATITRQAWWSIASGQATLSTASTPSVTYNTAANTTLYTAGTSTAAHVVVRGKLVIAAGGTLIPQLSQLTNSAAAIVGNDSYFRIWPVGSNTVQTVGNWS